MNDAVQPASGDAVSRKALLELLEQEMKDGDETWSGAMKWVAYQVEKGRIPSIPSPADGRYREALEASRKEIGLWNDPAAALNVIMAILDNALSPRGEQPKETPREALEQAIRDYDITQGGDNATSLIAWLESVTSFVYDKDTDGDGHWTDEKCPRCGARLLANGNGDKWCSNAGGSGMSACRYGLEDSDA